MKPRHSNSISPNSPATARRSSQPASTLYGTQRDNKTISANQKQLPLLTRRSHSPRLPRGYAAVLKQYCPTLLFFSVLSQFHSQMNYLYFSNTFSPSHLLLFFVYEECLEKKGKELSFRFAIIGLH